MARAESLQKLLNLLLARWLHGLVRFKIIIVKLRKLVDLECTLITASREVSRLWHARSAKDDKELGLHTSRNDESGLETLVDVLQEAHELCCRHQQERLIVWSLWAVKIEAERKL